MEVRTKKIVTASATVSRNRLSPHMRSGGMKSPGDRGGLEIDFSRLIMTAFGVAGRRSQVKDHQRWFRASHWQRQVVFRNGCYGR
jgi:hypothetical protein